MDQKKDIYEKYLVPYLKRVSEGKATNEEYAAFPNVLKVIFDYYSFS